MKKTKFLRSSVTFRSCPIVKIKHIVHSEQLYNGSYDVIRFHFDTGQMVDWLYASADARDKDYLKVVKALSVGNIAYI